MKRVHNVLISFIPFTLEEEFYGELVRENTSVQECARNSIKISLPNFCRVDKVEKFNSRFTNIPVINLVLSAMANN